MTTYEAFKAVWAAAARLGLVDTEGERLLGLEAQVEVWRFHGDRWECLHDAFGENQVTPAEYAERALQMIEEFRRHLFRTKLEQRLVELGRSA